MGRFEVTFRKFAVLSGVRQEAGSYAICVQPPSSALQRRGTLMLMAEPAGLHASFGIDACRLAQSAIIEHYYGDHSLSLTSGLINALDSANNSLLQYNYEKAEPLTQGEGGNIGSVAVQGGGVTTKKAKVGLTAVLLRPDGAGVYIAQTAPAQLYLVHNGFLTAIPQPPGWQTEHQSSVHMVRDSEENENGEVDEELPIPAFQAAPLGSRPGVDADLLFRRVEAGDLLVAVSSSLARHLDRVTTERLFLEGDADSVTEALHQIAMESGLAEAHACVLELGTEVRSGVETDLRTPLSAPHGEDVARNGGANGAIDVLPGEEKHSRQVMPSLGSARQWLSRRRTADSSPTPEEAGAVEEQNETTGPSPAINSLPTEALVAHTVERPPFQLVTDISGSAVANTEEELDFDGWEDEPPALAGKADAQSSPTLVHDRSNTNRVVIKPSGHSDRPMTHGSGALQQSPYKIPTLFELETEEDTPGIGMGPPRQIRTYKPPTMSGGAIIRRAGATLKTALANLAPDRAANEGQANPRPMLAPARALIGAGVLVLCGLLIFSVLSMTAGGGQGTATLLQQATQEDLLANQPNTNPTERRTHLVAALELARQAVTTSPASDEGRLLVTKIQSELDKIEGVTRLSAAKLLFDLNDAGKSAASIPGAPGLEAPTLSASEVSQVPVTGTVAMSDIVIQGNDAYILDKSQHRIYRCKIAAQTCALALSAGDTVSGQKVGQLAYLTSRVTNIVALDGAQVAYIFEPDSNAWQAQALGDAAKLQPARDVATYDGNLYLLAAKPGQVSKYIAGKYGEAPEDWIKDPATSAQVKEPVAMAIDGVIYVLLQDGKILAMQGGKLARTITPKDTGSGASPSELFTATDVQDLYLLRAAEGSITKISKEGQAGAILKAPIAIHQLSVINGITVDEGRGKLYMLSGTKLYEAQLPGKVPAPAPADSQPATDQNSQKPAARPTAAP